MRLHQNQKPTIVLTADDSLMSNFRQRTYYGFASCFSSNIIMESEIKKICPSVKSYPDGKAKLAPLSLRILESILYGAGFKKEEIATVHPKNLNKIAGPKTKIIGVSTIDPRGLGPLTKTLCSLHGGEPYTKKFFNRLISITKNLKAKYHVKVIVGGPGAWQLSSERLLNNYGIDYLIIGEAENVVPHLFKEIVAGNADCFPKIIEGKPANVEDIPSISGPTTNGLIEISRGCGRGCKWCFSSTQGSMRCLPPYTIKKSAEVNVKGKMANITLQSDDVLLYGSNSKKFLPDPDAVLTLLKELYSTKGIKSISLLHFSIASVVADADIIPKVTSFIRSHDMRARKYFDVQIGIETGSPNMIEEHMRGKTLPFSPVEWPTTVKKASQILKENGWFCYATLILGLPGENRDDIMQTIELIRDIRDSSMAVIPLFFVPLSTTQLRGELRLSRKSMLQKYGLLFSELVKHNEKIVSRYKKNKQILEFFPFNP